jgi:hypothetical protein
MKNVLLEQPSSFVEINFFSVAGEIFWSVKNGIPVSPADVEMTGYALMAYLRRTDLLINATKIVKWLSKQRNQFGGFLSTQVCDKIDE